MGHTHTRGGTWKNGVDRRRRLAVAIALGWLLCSARASAQTAGPPHESDDDPWPNAHPHFVISGSIGTCTREDPNVGGAGLCGEGAVGINVHLIGRLRFDLEHGAGGMKGVSVGYPTLGLPRGSGGFYGSVRAMLGYDVTRRFFFRAGPQVRLTYALKSFAPGVQAVVDLGTRVGNHVELGLRGFVGVDGIIASNTKETRESSAFAFGTDLLFRVFVP